MFLFFPGLSFGCGELWIRPLGILHHWKLGTAVQKQRALGVCRENAVSNSSLPCFDKPVSAPDWTVNGPTDFR